MADLRKRVNAKDPSGLRATEDRRAEEVLRDFDSALAKIVARVKSQNITSPAEVQQLVEEEIGSFGEDVESRLVKWVLETAGRGAGRAGSLLKAGGIQVTAVLGPRAVSKEVREILEVSVRNDIASLTADMQQVITRELIDGISAGEGARDLTRRLQDATGMERNRADIIARTETMEAFRQSSTDQYGRYGITEEEWLTAHDDRVCDECAALDGKKFPIGEAPRVHGGTNARCRCILLPVIPEAA